MPSFPLLFKNILIKLYISSPEINQTIADGFVTDKKDIILGIKTADCAPILFADEKSNVIGACHAGWRGAFAGIIKNTIDEMIRIGAKRENIIAAIGPSIMQESYEIYESFYLEFLEQNRENDKYFTQSINSNNYMFNLPQYCFDMLKDEGVKNISLSNIDTYQNDNYFSHRFSTHNDEPYCGRNLSAIVLK
jgi:YfiH family protein